MEDAIKTSQGKVGITFADDTRVQVNENSRLVIDDFVYDPKAKAGKVALNMASGTVRYASGAIAKNNPSKVAINTPTATIAVRGTDFTATVDELGASTIILLPSCVDKIKTVDQLDPKDKNCVTGIIDVITDAGRVTLDKPFQATRVDSRNSPPLKPVVLSLSIDAMNGLLILSPPNELKRAQQDQKNLASASLLQQDFLKEADLGNVLADQQKEIFKSKLAQNFLDQEFLNNLLTLLNDQLNENLLKVPDGLLPDYKPTTGIKVAVDEMSVELCRNNGSDRQCVAVNKLESSTIYQQQGNVMIKNRVNSGNGTVITIIQR